MHPKIQEGNFHESINRAIAEGRHVEYLQEVLKKYEEYKQEDEIRIRDIDYSKAPKLEFMFDFGDGHRFDVVYKGMRTVAGKAKARGFLRVTDQRGVAPEQYPAYD